MLDRLAADEQAICDLGIGQPMSEQHEYLGLALVRTPEVRGVAPPPRSERPHQCADSVCLTACGQALETFECGARFDKRGAGFLRCQGPRELKVSLRELHRRLRPREARQRFAQPSTRVAYRCGQTELASSHRRSCPLIGTRILRDAVHESIERRLRTGLVTCTDMSIDERRPQRHGR